QNRAPAEPRLKALEAQLFEEPVIVADRKAPFVVVVLEKLGCRTAPATARLTIGAIPHAAHSSCAIKNESRWLARDGVISRISALTMPWATKGSSLTRCSSSARDVS